MSLSGSSIPPNDQLISVSMGIKFDTGKPQVHCCWCSQRFTKLGNFKNHLQREHQINPGKHGFIPSTRMQGSGLGPEVMHPIPRSPDISSQHQRLSPNPNSTPTPALPSYKYSATLQGSQFEATTLQPPFLTSPQHGLSAQTVTLNAGQPSDPTNQNTALPANSPANSAFNDSVAYTIDNSSEFMSPYQVQYQNFRSSF
ncbi:hypothetical protein F4781DRAFT_428361 [Annulohypoxylon bovei var. microspora]|nr:hypothetical protein F4781DRAFT_428361 [Annulohypoxylon bovei var. microspora]